MIVGLLLELTESESGEGVDFGGELGSFREGMIAGMNSASAPIAATQIVTLCGFVSGLLGIVRE